MAGSSSGFLRLVGLYVALFVAYGAVSPFLAAFLASRGLSPEAIGLVLAAGTAARLAAGPLGGYVADRLAAPRMVLVACTAAAAVVGFTYLPAADLWPLLCASVAHATVLAPITPLADALTLAAAGSSRQPGSLWRRFDYGWVRGTGSAAFILGTLLAGQVVGRYGLDSIIWLNGLLLGGAAWCGVWVPDVIHSVTRAVTKQAGSLRTLLRLRPFRRLMLVAALIQGSHAMHDGFVVIHWRSVGIQDSTIGLLWSEAVAAEIVVFLFAGRPLVNWLGPAGASMLAAVGGIMRWAVLAQTTSVTASALVEPLHGLTFALQHLACMRLIGDTVPLRLAATAQAFYGTVAVGVASVLLTIGSGLLYAHFGAAGFWAMSGLCTAAIPVAWFLRRPSVGDNC
ncbi:MFS transporter [Rhodopila sp.]|uniref:MFS transporter n=1 Tax=Rhodopila sp. TaxID=2480087 RepID=UPI003D0A15FD